MQIRLIDIDPPVDTVILPSGREIPVRPADAGVMELALETPGTATLPQLLTIARRLLPDATEEELRSLTIGMLNAVLQAGVKSAMEVYTRVGESLAPEAMAAASRRSPLAPSSPPSASG